MDFNKDFSQVSPLDTNNSMNSIKSGSEEETIRKLSKMLNNRKVREKGSEYLIDILIGMYKHIIGSPQYYSQKSYENYVQHVNKIDPETEKKVKYWFNQNEVIDSISLVLKHISDLKSGEMEKFINVLIKIQYSNFDNWKIILRQYVLYISLLDTNYQPLRDKDVCQILHHLKNMYNYLPYTADKEVQTLLDKSINDSINYLIKTFDGLQITHYGKTLSAISKLGLLDEQMCKNLEYILIPKLKNNLIPGNIFVNILFCIYKNNCASENLIRHLEKYCEMILDRYNEDMSKFNPYVVAMIAKSLYYGFQTENVKLFRKLENVFIKNSNLFQIHQTVMLAHSLQFLTKPSGEFINLVDKILKEFNEINILTELLTFQIITVLLKGNSFSLENIKKYISLYKNFINKNQVKRKQRETFRAMIRIKLKKGDIDPETSEFLNKVMRGMGENNVNNYNHSDLNLNLNNI
jgi:hypothetical protein